MTYYCQTHISMVRLKLGGAEGRGLEQGVGGEEHGVPRALRGPGPSFVRVNGSVSNFFRASRGNV